MRLSELYDQDPKLALDYVLDKGEQTWHKYVTLHVGGLGIDGRTRYGSYKQVTRQTLKDREYDIEFLDHNVGILFTDVLFDQRYNKYIKKEL